jgi:hypothetical protein
MQGEALVRGVFEDMLKLDSMYCSPTVMPRLIAKYDSYNISLPPEQVSLGKLFSSSTLRY